MTATAPGELLERGAPSAAIDAVLAAGQRADGRVLLIEGPPGIGKSRLLHELRGRAEGTSRVLTARASKLEQAYAFGVVRQLLEGVLRDPGVAAIAYEGAGASARGVFEEAPTEASGASYAILHGLHWLMLNLAESEPLVLAIDDLHWCDSSSLRFLLYLARRVEGSPIVLAATTRPVPQAHGDGPAAEVLTELLGELLAEPTAVHVYPQPLTVDGSSVLLTEQLGTSPHPRFAQACFDATDGNPLLLHQLAHSLRAEGTVPGAEEAGTVRRVAHRALSRTVLARVGRLSPGTVATARAIAVLGEAASVALVAALAGQPENDVVVASGELIAVDVLRRDGDLEFVHALVRDAIYFDLPGPERERMHGRAARLLDAMGAPAERVAGQLELAPRTGDGWVVDIAVQAAEAAVRRGAPDAAATALRRALQEPPTSDETRTLTRALGTLLVDVNGPQAVEALREAAALEPDPIEQVSIELELIQALIFTGGHVEANALARNRLGSLPADATDLRALLTAFRANAAMFGADDPAAFDVIRDPAAIVEGDSPAQRVLASLIALGWAYDGRPSADCVELALWSISGDQLLLRRQPMPATGALLTLSLADRTESLGVWEDARAEAHRTGAQLLHWTIDVWLGAERQRRGDLGEAVETLRRAQTIGRRWMAGGSSPFGNHFSDAPLALALVDQGDIAGARSVLDELVPPSTGATLSTMLYLHSDAYVKLAEGRNEDALEVTRGQERRNEWARVPIGCDWHLPRALALHRLGRTEEAIPVAQEALAIAERWGAPSAVGVALRVRGELRGAEGLRDLERSVALLETSTARLELAKSLAAYGAALRRGRQPTEARVPLERAHELARACDATAVVESIRKELAASGVRRVRDEVGGAGALTPSERRVADLASGGRSNREIAQELFVTPKTVEVHLSAAYRKLGIASRHALAGALAA